MEVATRGRPRRTRRPSGSGRSVAAPPRRTDDGDPRPERIRQDDAAPLIAGLERLRAGTVLDRGRAPASRTAHRRVRVPGPGVAAAIGPREPRTRPAAPRHAGRRRRAAASGTRRLCSVSRTSSIDGPIGCRRRRTPRQPGPCAVPAGAARAAGRTARRPGRRTYTRLLDELPQLLAAFEATTLLVTHDRHEALRLAQDLVVLVDGRVMASATRARSPSPGSRAVAERTGHSVLEIQERRLAHPPGALQWGPGSVEFTITVQAVIDLVESEEVWADRRRPGAPRLRRTVPHRARRTGCCSTRRDPPSRVILRRTSGSRRRLGRHGDRRAI